MKPETPDDSLLSENRSRKKKRIKKWIKKSFVLVLIGISIWYFFLKPEPPIEYVTEKVQTGTVRQIVEVNGTVESQTKRELAFRTSGSISSILKNVGDRVAKDEAIATLDAGILSIEVEKAEAAMQMAQAELDLKYVGPTAEERKISETQIEEAQLMLTHLGKKLDDTIKANRQKIIKAEQEVENAQIAVENAQSAYQIAQDSGDIDRTISGKGQNDTLLESKKTALSGLNTIDHALSTANDIIGKNQYGSESAKFPYIGFRAQQEKINAINNHKALQSNYSSLEESYSDIDGSTDELEIQEYLQNLEEAISSTRILMDDVFFLLNNSITGTNLTQPEIDTYKTSVKSDQSALLIVLDSVRDAMRDIQNAALSVEDTTSSTSGSIENAKTNLDAKKSLLLSAEKNLNEIKTQNENAISAIKRDIETQKLQLKKAEESHKKLIAPPRNVDTAALQASVQQRIATWKQAVQNLEDTIIRAPAEGIITDITWEEGENITAGNPVITMMTDGLQIKVNIPETDITKLSVGNPAEIQLDAFASDVVFEGKISEIDPAETVIQGVIYYEGVIDFENEDERIKSGMTSDIEILSAEKEEVLVLSPEAIQYEGDQPFVFTLENGEKKRKNIDTGIEGERYVEIESGIEEGEEVVLYEKEKE
jgi:HlyD family secretion protein